MGQLDFASAHHGELNQPLPQRYQILEESLFAWQSSAGVSSSSKQQLVLRAATSVLEDLASRHQQQPQASKQASKQLFEARSMGIRGSLQVLASNPHLLLPREAMLNLGACYFICDPYWVPGARAVLLIAGISRGESPSKPEPLLNSPGDARIDPSSN